MPIQVELFIKAKAGRRANGNESDKGLITHAVLGKHGLTALCGTKPTHDWGEWEESKVTCEKCLKRLNGSLNNLENIQG